MMLEEGEKPVEMTKPDKRSVMEMVLGKYKEQEAPEVQYPEPYAVDKKLRAEGFQVPQEKRLFFERIARMLGR